MIQLGVCADGCDLNYDATLYEFRRDRELLAYEDVARMDSRGLVRWLAPEQRDWFRRINPADLDRCNRRALGRHGNGYEQLTPAEQVQRDAKRNDSVLAGKIVEADPTVVQAVIEELRQQGVFESMGSMSPYAGVAMPDGMESLSQLQRQPGRKMTMTEHYLMQKILKNDDKEKVRREKRMAAVEKKEHHQSEVEEKQLASKANIQKAQKRVARNDRREEMQTRRYSEKALRQYGMTQGRSADDDEMNIDYALDRVEASVARVPHTGDYTPSAAPARNIRYYDSLGNPIRPEMDAISPAASQIAYEESDEARALREMRERNLADQSRYDQISTDVPGMESAGKSRNRRRNEGASINGHEVNADGTLKDTRFKKAMDGLGKFNEAISPLVGGGHGMGGGPGGGGMGGSPGGGMGGAGGGMGGGMGR